MTFECSGVPISISAFSASDAGRAGLHAGAAGDAFRGEEVLVHAGDDAAVEAAALDGQREGALHLLAGAHAAVADDALGRVVGEIGVGLVHRHVQRVLGVEAFGATWLAPGAKRTSCRPTAPAMSLQLADAVGRVRSGVVSGGRRRRAPSPPCAGAAAVRSGCGRPCRPRPAWCRRPACPRRPSISTRQSRQEPKLSSMSVAQSLGISVPTSIAARMIEVPAGTVTASPSMVSVTGRSALAGPGCRSRSRGSGSSFLLRSGRQAPARRRNPQGSASARSSPDMA